MFVKSKQPYIFQLNIFKNLICLKCFLKANNLSSGKHFWRLNWNLSSFWKIFWQTTIWSPGSSCFHQDLWNHVLLPCYLNILHWEYQSSIAHPPSHSNSNWYSFWFRLNTALHQGGRCRGTAQPAVRERSVSSTNGRTPNICYFVAKLSIVAICALFERRS